MRHSVTFLSGFLASLNIISMAGAQQVGCAIQWKSPSTIVDICFDDRVSCNAIMDELEKRIDKYGLPLSDGCHMIVPFTESCEQAVKANEEIYERAKSNGLSIDIQMEVVPQEYFLFLYAESLNMSTVRHGWTCMNGQSSAIPAFSATASK